MKTTKYYFPINSVNLSSYFSRALIYPAIYENERINDIQSINNTSLLLCKKIKTINSNCCLEIILFDKDQKELEPISKTNYYIYNKPLPISRVVSIHFFNEEQKKISIYNARTCSFIPDWLIELNTDIKDKDIDKEKGIKQLSNNGIDFTKEITHFDKWLGAFAFLQFGAVSNNKYPISYFENLSIFNIELKSKLIEILNDFNPLLKGAIEKDSDFWNRLYPYIFDEKEINIVSLAKEKNIEINLRNNKYDINRFRHNDFLYIIAFLDLYGDNSVLTRDNLVSEFLSGKIRKDLEDVIKSIFGLKYGYDNFRNKYIISNNELDIKFKLERKLDYITIESIYQFIFNKEFNNDSFDNNFKQIFNIIDKNSKTNIRQSNDISFPIFDKDLFFEKINLKRLNDNWKKLKKDVNKYFEENNELMRTVEDLSYDFKNLSFQYLILMNNLTENNKINSKSSVTKKNTSKKKKLNSMDEERLI